jgi:transposase
MVVHRKFSPELKARVVLELISGATSLAEACRQYHLKPQALSRWKTEFLEKAPQLFQTREQSSQEQARIAELERMIGRLTLEREIAKKASAMSPGSLGRSERWS